MRLPPSDSTPGGAVQLEEEVRLTKEENSSLKRKLMDLEAQVPVRSSCFWA